MRDCPGARVWGQGGTELTLRVKHLLYCASDAGGVSTDDELISIARDQSHEWRWCGSHAYRRACAGLGWKLESGLGGIAGGAVELVPRACT